MAELTKAVPSGVSNPDAGITMTRLANGHLVLVFNDSETEANAAQRGSLARRGIDLGTPDEFGVESGRIFLSLCDPDRRRPDSRFVHVSRYAIKHVEFNEDWIIHTERPD